jgi:hypothetical protein
MEKAGAFDVIHCVTISPIHYSHKEYAQVKLCGIPFMSVLVSMLVFALVSVSVSVLVFVLVLD